MPKNPRSANDRTDPQISSPDHDTHVGPAPEADDGASREPSRPRPGGGVHLGPPGSGPAVNEQTAVGAAPAQDDEPFLGTSEATVVSQNPLDETRPRAGRPRGRLLVVEGKEEGRSIDLVDGRIVFGRSKDCDVALLDIQISRRHIEVEADRGGVLVRDLGSGNGTLVNGEPIDEVRLSNGDEITLGDHVLRFEEAAEAPSALPAVSRRRAAPAARAGADVPVAAAVDVVRRARHRRTKGRDDGGEKKKKLVIVAAAAVVIAGVAVMVLLQPEEEIIPQGPTPEEVAQQRFSAGMQAFRGESYEEALEHFEAAVASMPQHQQAGRYLAATRREMAGREAMTEGEELLSRKDYEGAREAFRPVAEDPEALLGQDARAALSRVDEAEAGALSGEAEDLLEADALDEAEAVFRRALAVVEDFEPATSGLRRVQERRDEMSRMSEQERRRIRLEQERKRREEEERARREVREALARGETLFDQGNFHGALRVFSELRQSENTEIARQAHEKGEALRRFGPAYERGMAAAEAGTRSTEEAVNHLTVATEQARVISRGGATHQKVRSRLAEMHSLQARVAFNAGRYTVAYNEWSAALRAAPNHSASQSGMAELERLGEEMYLQAYTARRLNRQEAIRKFKQVIAMTPPRSETHTKAQQRLDELER